MPGNNWPIRIHCALVAEALEPRRLLAANLHLVDSYFVDQTFNNPIPNPVVGTSVYLRTDFTTTDLPSNASYTLNQTVQGVSYPFDLTWGAGVSGTLPWEFVFGPLPIKRGGASTVTVQLDSQNTVAESDETDNTASFPFTPMQLSLQAKLAQPLGAVAERNYGYVNYVDEDPSSPGFADYRGGPYTYDGHDAIDMTFPNFAAMDAGVPVIAAEAGTVVDEHDGEFDRNTFGMPDANYIEIDSGNGYQQYYYHLRDGSVGVKIGDTVQQGQVIGLMGSSGNSTGPHLHFAVYNGGPVETYQDPYTYWQNPVPYEGDVDFVEDSGVTNYNPSSILNAEERPPDNLNFKQQSGQVAYSWFTSFTAPNEPASIVYYRPNGTAFSTFTFTTNSNPNRGGYNYASVNLPSSPDLGTWQVAFTVNGVELARKSFTVSATGVAGAQVSQGSTFIANTRETPIEGGTYSQGAAAAAISFTVTNFGNASMTLGTPTLPAGWIVTDPLVSTLTAGASDTLGLTLDTGVAGYRYGFLSFTTSDPNQPTYSFALQGEVDPAGATPAVSIYSRDTTAAETGSQPGVFRVQRTGDPSAALTVSFTISGTATNGSDYNTIPSSVTIPAGQSTASVIVTPIDDATPESTETVTLTLASSAGYSIGPNSDSTVSIADNDTPGTGAISGHVYLDSNFNTYQDAGEGTLANIGLFLDTNSNGVRDPGEPQTTTDSSGNFTFSSLPAGLYNLRPTSNAAFLMTTPLGSYSVVSGQTLAVNLGAFPVSFTAASGNNTFAVAPGASVSRMAISVNASSYSALISQIQSLTFTSGSGNDTLNFSGPSGIPITFAAGTGNDTLNVNASTLTLASDVQPGAANLTVNVAGGANLVMNSTQHLAALNVNGGTTTLAASGSQVLVTNTFSSTSNGQLDLVNNSLIVNGMTANAVGALIAGGAIFSSLAATQPGTAIGYGQANTVFSTFPASFAGQLVGSTAVLARFTELGDANLDHTVDTLDFTALAQNFNKTSASFTQGDFNGDGKVNALDFNTLATKFGTSVIPPAGSLLPLSVLPAGPDLPTLFADARIEESALDDLLRSPN